MKIENFNDAAALISRLRDLAKARDWLQTLGQRSSAVTITKGNGSVNLAHVTTVPAVRALITEFIDENLRNLSRDLEDLGVVGNIMGPFEDASDE